MKEEIMSTTTVKGNFVRFRYWFTPISSSKKKRNFKHLPTILLLFTVLAVIIPLWVSGNQIKFERVSLKDGLSQSAVFSILQDRQGFMWFATQEGLNKYNGYDFKVFKHRIDEPESLSDNWINVIFEDSHGDLWVGTADGGLDKFDRSGEEFIHYQHQPQNVGSISDDHILTIYEDSRETLWIGTNQGGLNRFNRRREEFIRYTPEATNPNSLSHDKVTAICEDNSGALWIGTHGGGLNKLTRKSSANTDSVFFQHFRHQSDNPNSLSSDRVLSLHWEQSGYLWIGTNGGGLDKYNPRTGKFTHYLARPGEDGSLTDNRIYKIFQ
ncbi:MAG: histidine kinase, partial [Calditrichae bacterium]|nr:histidine kinase [Calditrichia bacterium]